MIQLKKLHTGNLKRLLFEQINKQKNYSYWKIIFDLNITIEKLILI